MFGSRRVVVVTYEMPLFTPIATQVRAHDLLEAGHYWRAVWLLFRRAQFNPRDALSAAKLLRSGHVLPDFPRPWKSDLATRVAELRDSGRYKEAVFTVRSEQSLSTADAEAYVNAA